MGRFATTLASGGRVFTIAVLLATSVVAGAPESAWAQYIPPGDTHYPATIDEIPQSLKDQYEYMRTAYPEKFGCVSGFSYYCVKSWDPATGTYYEDCSKPGVRQYRMRWKPKDSPCTNELMENRPNSCLVSPGKCHENTGMYSNFWIDSTCRYENKPDGTACDIEDWNMNKLACAETYTCRAGMCSVSTFKTCNTDECTTSSCNGITGECSEPVPKIICNSGDYGDFCQDPQPACPKCGDFYVTNNDDVEEECDDGNTEDGDGCSSDCKDEGDTCNDKKDNYEDELKDEQAVFACTDLSTASSLTAVKFKKENGEQKYPMPWPLPETVPAVKNAPEGSVKIYAPDSIDSVPKGLQEGFGMCYFGTDVTSPADDGLPREVAVQVEGKGEVKAYLCSPHPSGASTAVLQLLLQDSENAYKEQLRSVQEEIQASRSGFFRFFASLFSRVTAFLSAQVAPQGGSGADPNNARVALTQGCYSECVKKTGSNPAEQRKNVEACQTECVCGGANNYSAFSFEKGIKAMEDNKALLDAELKKFNDCIDRPPKIPKFRDVICADLSYSPQEQAEKKRLAQEATTAQKKAIDQQISEAKSVKRETVVKLLEEKLKRLERDEKMAVGPAKNSILNERSLTENLLRAIKNWTDEELKEPANVTLLKNQFQQISGEQTGCHAACMTTKSARCGNVNDVASQAQCCRAKCVEEICPFERPAFTPKKSTITTPAPPQGNPTGATTGGGQGGDDGGEDTGGDEGGDDGGGDEGGDDGGGDTGATGATGQTGGGFFSSAQRSRASASSTASVAVSGEACFTKYVVPAEYVPNPATQLGDGQQTAYSGQFFIPWNFQDAQGIQKDFNVFLGDIAYENGGKRFRRGTWSTVSLNGTFSKPVQADVSAIPNERSFSKPSGLYDGKDTMWNLALQDAAECKKEMVDNSERRLCNIHVQKTTVSTNTAQRIVIPNSSWLEVRLLNGGDGWALVASDSSLWFAIATADVLINVRPDMSVRVIPFPSKGCTSVGRPVLRYGDSYCRGAMRLAEGPDGSMWFTTDLQAEGEKFPQIGIVKNDGTVNMVSFAWEDMIFVEQFFPGYDGAMWFTYRRPNMVETTLPDPNRHVARMTMAGELTFVQTPATVVRMAAGKNGMWYLGNIVTGAPPALPTYRPVIGFLGRTDADSTLQALPPDVFRRLSNPPLLVDKDNVPWTRVPNWKNASAASSQTAQYYEAISTLPDTQSVIKFVCGPSSAPKSSSSSVSSSLSSSSRTSVASVSSSSSRPSSVGGSSLGGSVGLCPADPCGAQGNAYCGAFGLRCAPLSGLPCFTCVLSQSSGASSVPQPSSARSSLGVAFSQPRSQGGMTGGIPPFPPRSAGASSRQNDPALPISVLRPQIENVPLPSRPPLQQTSSRPPLAVSAPRPLPSAVLADRSLCGNGMQERGEECDDKNSRSFDGCSADCLLERGRCGDGIVQTLLDEQCEPSLHDASLPYGCSQDCRFASSLCGNGVVDEGEQCDAARLNSNAQNAFCRLDCSFARCSDGIIDSKQGEQCDDGNRIGSDGCSERCTLERTAPSPLAAQVFTLPKAPGLQQSPSPTGPAVQGYTAQAWQVLPQTTVPVTAASGPGALMVMAGGAAAGVGYIRRRRRP